MSSLKFGGIRIPYQAATLHLEKADEFISERGVSVQWWKAHICPCVDLNGVPNSYCSYCYGRGYAYTYDSDIQVVFTRLEAIPQFAQPGLWVFGTAYITTQSYIKLGMRDRLLFPNFEGVFLETFIKSGDSFKFPRAITSIESIKRIADDGSLYTLVEGVDYTFDIDTITFINIPDDVRISIRLQAPVVYVVVNILHEARGIKDLQGREVELPNQYLVQREDTILGSKQNFINTLNS